MNQILFDCIAEHKHEAVSPPRPRAKDFEITSVNEHKGVVKIRFEGRKYDALPLTFEMFDRALALIKAENGEWVPLGTSINNPQLGTIEGEIWKKPYPINRKSPYKTASHICDFLVLADLAEYGKVINPISGRMVQAIRLVLDEDSTIERQLKEVKSALKTKKSTNEGVPVDKDRFLRKYKQVILDWTKVNKSRLIEGRKNYSWEDKEPKACLAERNQVSQAIVLSRIQNSGGVDLETLDMIMSWGGFPQFPLRDENKVLELTRRVFDFVDKGRVSDAIEELLAIKGVGIARASKIIGLFDQQRFCIYDSRVGQALKTLQFTEKPVLKCPAGRARAGDICSDSRWAENYERLIWTLEIIRDYLHSEGYPFSIADIEMALFMMEK